MNIMRWNYSFAFLKNMNYKDGYEGPFGPIIDELNDLVPKFPNTGNPKDEAIYFAYQQARIAYYFLCNLLQNKSQVIGIYIYAWSIVDNADRYSKLIGKRISGLKQIRDGFQHIDEKIELYKKSSIPVYGSISYWLKKKNGQPEFDFFPKELGRSYYGAGLNNTDSYHDGISHLTISALANEKGQNNKGQNNKARQQVLRLDTLVLNMGREVCLKFGKENG